MQGRCAWEGEPPEEARDLAAEGWPVLLVRRTQEIGVDARRERCAAQDVAESVGDDGQVRRLDEPGHERRVVDAQDGQGVIHRERVRLEGGEQLPRLLRVRRERQGAAVRQRLEDLLHGGAHDFFMGNRIIDHEDTKGLHGGTSLAMIRKQ